jgi:hypothetical protein
MNDAHATETPGRNSFDFFVGDWRVANRRLRDYFDPASGWEEFSAESRMHILPGAIGNVDSFNAPEWRPGWMGMSLRIFNGETGLWSIWWLTHTNGGLDAAGQLGVPMVGRFDGDIGRFEAVEPMRGQNVDVRFEWRAHPTRPHWQQSFSFDGGATWHLNWQMQFERV